MADFENLTEFQRSVTTLLTKAGWQIIPPPENVKGYDFEAVKGEDVVALQIRDSKAPVKVPQLEKFLDFLELPIAHRFTRGIFFSSSGYSPQAITYFAQVNSQKVKLAILKEGAVHWVKVEEREPEPLPKDLTYMGVFTSKGGVGKTTISAHLAGAFALSGYDVALIDLDPQKNLTTLLGEGIKLPATSKDPGNTVTIYNINEWDEANPPDVQVAICDCSPVFEQNPIQLIEKFTYCIMPTTLNPLGINKNGYVIRNTIEAIRRINKTAYLFVVINNYFEDETTKSQILKDQYRKFFAEFSTQDDRFRLIDPDEVAIRNSKQLFYWGYHIYSGTKPELAFTPIGGRCLPKADFLNLLNYLEDHTTLRTLKKS